MISQRDFLEHHFIFADNLIRITVASCSRKSKSFFLNVENYIVLSHESSAEQNLIRARKFLQSQTILSCFCSEHVFTGVPVEQLRGLIATCCHNFETKDWVAQEVILRPIGELDFIIMEADYVIVVVVNAFSLAVVDWVEHAEPVEMIQQNLEKSLRYICEGSS